MPPYRDPVQRFWEKVSKTSESGCWLWTGADDGYGYGVLGLSHPRRLAKAHRFSWELANGEVPSGLCVLHNCPGGDNSRCVNPAHLFLGTKDDNNKDKVKKGGQSRREAHGMAILTEKDVLGIKEEYASGLYTQKEVAAKYGTCRQNVGLIVGGKRWNK